MYKINMHLKTCNKREENVKDIFICDICKFITDLFFKFSGNKFKKIKKNWEIK